MSPKCCEFRLDFTVQSIWNFQVYSGAIYYLSANSYNALPANTWPKTSNPASNVNKAKTTEKINSKLTDSKKVSILKKRILESRATSC